VQNQTKLTGVDLVGVPPKGELSPRRRVAENIEVKLKGKKKMVAHNRHGGRHVRLNRGILRIILEQKGGGRG